jgi:hypothetical protein
MAVDIDLASVLHPNTALMACAAVPPNGPANAVPNVGATAPMIKL